MCRDLELHALNVIIGDEYSLIQGRRLSVCIIARNEESHLPRALESVRPIADQVVVVDTGSTDNTVAIATESGAHVVHDVWDDDFSRVRNVALAHAVGEWVLMLDADEAVSEEMARRLPQLLADADADCFITMMVNMDGQQVTGRGPVLRLFRNRQQYRFRGRIHEDIQESILRAGGKIKHASLEILHFGYTAREDRRKARYERNVRLLEASLKEEPDRVEIWYYLGMEYFKRGELNEADWVFARMMELAPADERSLAAASFRSELWLIQQRADEAWRLAATSLRSRYWRRDSLVRVARAALAEGDFLVALDCVNELRSSSPEGDGYIPISPALLVDLESTARWEAGEREEALGQWRAGVEANPNDLSLADNWVRHLVLARGLKEGTLGAVRTLRLPVVAAAAVGALLRAGDLKLAAALSESFQAQGAPSAYFLHGLAINGRWDGARAIAEHMGVDGQLHLATAALRNNQELLVGESLTQMPAVWRGTLEALLNGSAITSEQHWVTEAWMTLWAKVGALDLFQFGATRLPGSEAEVASRAALLLFRTGYLGAAVELALNHPQEPEAAEVLGLVAFETADWDTAAQMLSFRVRSGRASVRVYHRAATALIRSGRVAEAETLLSAGRRQHPQSHLLVGMGG